MKSFRFFDSLISFAFEILYRYFQGLDCYVLQLLQYAVPVSCHILSVFGKSCDSFVQDLQEFLEFLGAVDHAGRVSHPVQLLHRMLL